MIILDASAAVDLLVEESDPGKWVAEQVAREENLGAPHLIDLEVMSSLRRLVSRQEIPRARARDAITGLAELGIIRYPVMDLVERIWQLHERLTPYDAAYVVLSETLGVPLVTTDLRLARSHGHRAEILAYPA